MRILRLSPSLLARLDGTPGPAGRVHSVFTGAVNLLWEDGHLLTLHGPGWVRAPFAAACDRVPDVLRPGAPVRRLPGSLAFAEVEVRWDSPVLWAPGPPPVASLDSIPSLFADPRVEAAGAFWERDLEGLAEAIRSRSARRFLSCAMRLVGRGEGLTPAGDDWLVGALAALWRFDRVWRARLRAIRGPLLAYAAGATTTVSAEFLAHALAGTFSEPLLRLATAADSAGAREAAAVLSGFGATSGVHTLVGFLIAHRALGG